MKARAILFACLMALGSPSFANEANTEVVNKYISLVKQGQYRAAESLMTPKIVWTNQNFPQGREAVAGAYSIYLAISAIKVGTLKKVNCQRVDDVEVSCVFTRESLFGGGRSDLTERYFVSDGKITRIADTIPAEISSIGQERGN